MMLTLRHLFTKKTRTQKDFIRTSILGNFVFSSLEDAELNVMIDAFERIERSKGDVIIKEGDEGDYYYVIESGEIQYSINGKNVGDPAKKGATFGELALLYSAPRAATCTAITNKLVLYQVDQKTFRFILQHQTQNADSLKRNLLKDISFLKDMEENDLNKLAENMRPLTFSKGDRLVKKGDEGDMFYVLQEGKVKVTNIEAGGKAYDDVELGPGEYFGERALVLKEPRAANITALTDGIALCVDSDTFKTVMGNLGQLVMKSSDRRRLLGIDSFNKSNLDENDIGALVDRIKDEQLVPGKVLFAEGEKTPATLYIVRKGNVHLTKKGDRSYPKTLGTGGYFGEVMLLLDTKRSDNKSDSLAVAHYSATVGDEDCIVGKLTLADCRTVFDTTQMGATQKGRRRTGSIKDSDIAMKTLKYHTILGAGTFGQVWLVSRSSNSAPSGRQAYALKIQSKYELVKHSQAKGVVQEKNIMAQLVHPFIIQLVNTYQDKQRVYMLLDVVQGGELFSLMHSSSSDGLPIEDTVFYSASILEGLGHMHRRNILYRDLKPENVLIDSDGYPVIVDLGFAKIVKDKTFTLCGTPLYLAPEVILNRGHDKGADHWSLGVMIYEMLSGQTPFYKDGMDQISLFRAIVKGEFKYPHSRRKRADFFTEDAKYLISKLLTRSPSKRIGSLSGGEQEIYDADFFKGIQFEKLKRKAVKAPWKPSLKNPLDTSNFENWNHLEDKTKVNNPPISSKHNAIFSTF
mmetsp:Transcript_20045/g.22399  ORF Transcript_20045/g.22399 Transcript_20045/m.22399 type:complete len:745 (-) Transcript_20045:177-2411(-)